jgi:hypothetical protein
MQFPSGHSQRARHVAPAPGGLALTEQPRGYRVRILAVAVVRRWLTQVDPGLTLGLPQVDPRLTPG